MYLLLPGDIDIMSLFSTYLFQGDNDKKVESNCNAETGDWVPASFDRSDICYCDKPSCVDCDKIEPSDLGGKVEIGTKVRFQCLCILPYSYTRECLSTSKWSYENDKVGETDSFLCPKCNPSVSTNK